jgi:hypothetical protein
VALAPVGCQGKPWKGLLKAADPIDMHLFFHLNLGPD